MRYSQDGSQYASTAAQLASNLVNVRSIAAHFRPKIDAWSKANQIVTLTPEQVRKEKSLGDGFRYTCADDVEMLTCKHVCRSWK